MTNRLNKELFLFFHPPKVMLKGIALEKYEAFSTAQRPTLALAASQFLKDARPDVHFAPELETPVVNFQVLPMTNLWRISGGDAVNVTNLLMFGTECGYVTSFQDSRAYTDLYDQAVVHKSPRISKTEALTLATKALHGAALSGEFLHLGKPAVVRHEVPQASESPEKKRTLTLPAWEIVWNDDMGGKVTCIVSGLTKQVVAFDMSSKRFPTCPHDWYYQELGITNIPPIDARPF